MSATEDRQNQELLTKFTVCYSILATHFTFKKQSKETRADFKEVATTYMCSSGIELPI